ncbi:MAG: DUF2927 domain-containing protein [Oscillospiraceae bacterium]|nr:DUF2927 domain-containing protein [Oscillospiraceae bacterium]
MKKTAVFLLILAMLFCGCTPKTPAQNTEPTTEPTENSSVPTTEATEPEPSTMPTTVPTEPPHSALYLPQYSQQKVLEFFNEVVLNMEYSDGTGDTTLVQKWLTPIYYRYYGSPTNEDKTVLETLFAQLNAIPGFPGIYPVENAYQENLSLNFLNAQDFKNSFSDMVHGEDAWGATQFWYWTETNDIYTARIGYRADIDQVTRNSILLEEIINTLGISDTVLRQDSIVYQYSNDNLALSDVDWVILKILYDPEIQCGMDVAACAEIIQRLYY